jgi:hypothetical protein
MQPRTQWTKKLLLKCLLEQMKKKCANGLSVCREVFEVAGRFFQSWIQRYPKEELSGEDFMVVNELSASVQESPLDETTAWVSVFVSLYFCDNFPGFSEPAWNWLLRHDPGNLRYAIQACRYVHLSSGASGWDALKHMIKQHIPNEVAKPILSECGLEDLLKD